MIESIKEINKKYNGQWVFLINCKTNDDDNLIEGEVVLHSKSREEIFLNMNKYSNHPSMTSIRYAGKIPEEVNVIL